MNTFAFFIRQGAKIKPHFLKKASEQEITVNWHGTVIPVQCKNLRPGSGRRISQELFINLASSIALDMRKANKSLFIRIGATDNIPEEDIEFLRAQAQKYAGNTIAPMLVKNRKRIYSIMGQQLSNQVTDLLSEELHHRMVISEPEVRSGEFKPVAIVGIESNPIEKPLNSLSSAIMKGVRQLQGDKPGILAIYYTDPVEDFDDLCPSPLTMQLYISKLLTPFPHMGAVILSSEPDYLGADESDSGKTRIYFRKPWAFPKDFLLGNP
ncbi:hypothetical protein ACFLS8_03880 [Chloroflexota bacterium]